jgi:hypothetical protein
MAEPLDWMSVQANNPTAQELLVRSAEEAGLLHRVAPDGSLMVPCGLDSQVFLAMLYGELFPDGWYRAEPGSPALAERYRRFTARHGTSIFEELSEGHHSFIQAQVEKLYRMNGRPTRVSFSILGDEIDPEALTDLFNISPTFAARKGEPFRHPHAPYPLRPGVLPRPSRTGWWELCSIPEVMSNDIEIHLNWLLDQLEPIAERLSAFSSSDIAEGRILTINIVRWASYGGFYLEGEMLQRLAAICDGIRINLWTDDCSPLR